MMTNPKVKTRSPVSLYLAKIGARGGSQTSAAKTKAAKANGKKGGRPPLPKPKISYAKGCLVRRSARV